MSIAKELLIKKAHEGYTVCYVGACPLRTQCLRWQVGPHVPNTHSTYRCVNPHFEGVATTECPMYRNDQKVRFAKGMLYIFTDDMPKRVEPVSQWFATDSTCFAREDPQTVPRQWMDRRGEVRRLCRGL